MEDRENCWECSRREKRVLLKEINIFLGEEDIEDGREEKSIETLCQTKRQEDLCDIKWTWDMYVCVCNNDVEMCKDDKL